MTAICGIVCFSSFGTVQLSAADFTWDGGGGLNANWSNNLNWAGDILPANDGTATVFIAGSLPASLTSIIDQTYNIQYLKFAALTPSFTLSGSTLTIQGNTATSHDGDALLVNSSTNFQTIDANLILAKGGGINGNLIINGNIQSNGTLTTKDGLRFGSGNITLNGVVSTATSGDSVAINGATVTFNRANTFTKGFTVWSGTARAGVDALGISGTNGAFGATSATITVGHGGSSAATILAGGAVTIGHSANLASSTNVNFSYYTFGGDTAHTSNFTGTLTNGSASGAAMALRLTAAGSGRANFNGNIIRNSTATGSTDNVRKEGAGTVAINGAINNWEGETQVGQGILYVNGTIQANSSGKGITVALGTSLGGRGTANRAVSLASGAILAPGDPITNNGLGRLTIGNSLGTALTLNSTGGSILNFQISAVSDLNSSNRYANLNNDGSMNWNAVIAATLDSAFNNDTLALQGNLIQNGTGTTTTINLSLAGSGSLGAGMVWDLFDWSTVDGATGALTQNRYSLVVDSALSSQLAASGLSLDTSRFWDTGFVGVVPEPTRALLLIAGLCTFALRRRRTA